MKLLINKYIERKLLASTLISNEDHSNWRNRIQLRTFESLTTKPISFRRQNIMPIDTNEMLNTHSARSSRGIDEHEVQCIGEKEQKKVCLEECLYRLWKAPQLNHRHKANITAGIEISTTNRNFSPLFLFSIRFFVNKNCAFIHLYDLCMFLRSKCSGYLYCELGNITR